MTLAGSQDKLSLARLGYFHGYKGYRYAGQPNRPIPFTSFRQLCAVLEFDSNLKGLFYPVLMRLEMMMKNLALVEILEAADSSTLADVYSRLMPGTKREKMQGKLKVIHTSNETLLKAYVGGSRIVRHYYDSPQEAVPIWALFEVITLGQFARFIEQLSDQTLNAIAARWGMRRSDSQLVPHLVYAITSLRNAVAHNGVVFDTRFANEKVRKEIPQLLATRIGFQPNLQLDFGTTTDYFILVAYLACCLGFTKTEIKTLIKHYRTQIAILRQGVPKPVLDMIVHTNSSPKLGQLETWTKAR